jgi:hypothetical protein
VMQAWWMQAPLLTGRMISHWPELPPCTCLLAAQAVWSWCEGAQREHGGGGGAAAECRAPCCDLCVYRYASGWGRAGHGCEGHLAVGQADCLLPWPVCSSPHSRRWQWLGRISSRWPQSRLVIGNVKCSCEGACRRGGGGEPAAVCALLVACDRVR